MNLDNICSDQNKNNRAKNFYIEQWDNRFNIKKYPNPGNSPGFIWKVSPIMKNQKEQDSKELSPRPLENAPKTFNSKRSIC